MPQREKEPSSQDMGHRERVTCPGRTHGGEDTLAGLGLVSGVSLEPALPHSMRSLGQDAFQIYFFFFSFLKTRSLCAQDLILWSSFPSLTNTGFTGLCQHT